MGFEDDVTRFAQKVERIFAEAHRGCAEEALHSIVEGSALTGAPGSPVDTGHLRGSWHVVPVGPLHTLIVTNAAYARSIEEGTRAGREIVIRSPVGGSHSVALTRLGWDKIVNKVGAEVAARHP